MKELQDLLQIEGWFEQIKRERISKIKNEIKKATC
jgi:hypothetical protein